VVPLQLALERLLGLQREVLLVLVLLLVLVQQLGQL
jgi:hypothetical protein